MWVDVVLVLCVIVLFLLVTEGAYRIGHDRGYDAGFEDGTWGYGPWEHRPATRDGEPLEVPDFGVQWEERPKRR